MKTTDTIISRRTFLAGSAALGAAAMINPQKALAAKPDSNFNGVQIGAITYSYRSMPSSAEDLLGYLVTNGLSSVELKGGPAEQYARDNAEGDGMDGLMAGYTKLRKLYNDTGVNIHIVKFGNIGERRMPDKTIEYYLRAAKALGAKGITREMSRPIARRLGPMADEHKVMIAFHNHTQIRNDSYDGDYLKHEYLGINLDIGHYMAGLNESPIPFIDRHHEKILSFHLKDRKKDEGPNMPWGEGDTPIAEVLQHVRDKKYDIHGDIEVEYPIASSSDAVKEVGICAEYCKNALM